MYRAIARVVGRSAIYCFEEFRRFDSGYFCFRENESLAWGNEVRQSVERLLTECIWPVCCGSNVAENYVDGVLLLDVVQELYYNSNLFGFLFYPRVIIASR